ncbi:superfamily II DNA/RNA helicase [Actinoplanes tereljensis]|uniref:RNA helicase n=1 Tax=Paractinoplanes tereljensis TaxID=571912 RepID=A0A919NGD0_9ACTN|nr:DEAD/DEAH box helicase [Actinoplanes tereljensis]GIF17698.1 RNA helicase [Actinoplanes tereljensis]
MLTFSELGVPAALTQALAGLGITTPFPIQAATLPDSLAGRDVLGRGRTGSGKTYAFALPVLARLAASRSPRKPRRPRALILAPTRELATQIDAVLAPLAAVLGLRTLVVFGGVGANPQIKGLAAGVDVLVACPGRLDDHLRSGHASLDSVEVTVLDEADHMADLGFLPVVRRLLEQTPRDGQRLLFSATLDNGVDVLVKRFMRKPVTHSVDSATEAPVEMSHHVLHVHGDDRFGVLVDLLSAPGRSVVFTRTKRRAKVLTKQLITAGVPAVELHGNLAQNARNRNLAAFSDGSAETLVATDIAARGIHVDDVALVIHADPPVEHKAYLHRSGRTARAGAQGTVITLMTDDQQAEVRDLTRKAGVRPTTNRTRPGDPLLSELAPGERRFVTAAPAPQPTRTAQPARSSQPSRGAAPQSRGGQPSRAGQSSRGGQSARGGQPSRAAQPSRGGQPSRAGQSSEAVWSSSTSDRPTQRSAGQPARAGRARGRGAAHAAPGHTTEPAGSTGGGNRPRRGSGGQTSAGAAPTTAGRTSGAAAFSSSSRLGRR